MNITFLIGNGFDIHLGMKTRYIDFYEYYENHVDKADLIYGWKKKDNTDWSDLELALGNELSCVSSAEEKNTFLDSRDVLEDLLADYLHEQEKLIESTVVKESYADEFVRSVKAFDDGLAAADKNRVNSTMGYYSEQKRNYCILTFNYTNSLSMIWNNAVKKNPISTRKVKGTTYSDEISSLNYVHADLNSGLILAVDNSSQINNPMLSGDASFIRQFTKAGLIESVGELNYEKADKIIDESHIICIYGMSLGITDQRWWKKIVKWLQSDSRNLLIIYHYENVKNQKRNSAPRRVRTTESIKTRFFSNAGMSENQNLISQLSERILISYNNQLFNFIDSK